MMIELNEFPPGRLKISSLGIWALFVLITVFFGKHVIASPIASTQ